MKKLLCILCLLLMLACVFAACDGTETPKDEHTHTFGEWSVSKAATCTAKGEEKRTCECGESETREIEATGEHTYGDWSVTTAATCIAKGEEKRTCTGCTVFETKEIAAAHNYGTDNVCLKCQTPLIYTEGLEYILSDDKNFYIVKVGSATAVAKIIIPPYHEGKPVTSIGDEAFRDCTSLMSIEIPASVTFIDFRAFKNCTALISIEIPASVIYISDEAFQDCTSLVSMEISASVTCISQEAFLGCTQLIQEENGVYYADKWVVVVDDLFTNATLRPNTVGFCNYAFDCAEITSIEIPARVRSIGYRAFRHCGSLTSVTFAENSQLTSIGSDAFYDCTSLTSIEIPASVTSIGDGAFRGCTSLTSVTFAEDSQLTSIGSDAFWDCASLTSVEFPASVTSIGYGAFYGCTKLTSVTFAETSGWWYAPSSTATSGTSISVTDLADPATAAKYLRSTYYNFYWKRS